MDKSVFWQECKKYIEDSERRGYELALVNIGGGRYVHSHYRICMYKSQICIYLYNKLGYQFW